MKCWREERLCGDSLLSGVAALKAASDAEKRKAQWEHQSTQYVAGPEGEKPQQP
jgi:hypothetical protein